MNISLLKFTPPNLYNPLPSNYRRKRPVRKGYLGHVYRIANEIQRNGNIEEKIKSYLDSNPKWNEFIETKLKKSNEANNTEIGGYNPRTYYQEQQQANESQFGATVGNEATVLNNANNQLDENTTNTLSVESSRHQ